MAWLLEGFFFFFLLFEKVFYFDVKVKTVLSVLCFRLLVNVFVLIRENKKEKEKALTNEANFHVILRF